MSRIRRYLVPALLLLPVIFVCGKLLLTPVKAEFGPERLPKNYSGIMGSGLLGPREVGWPWVYRKTTDGTRMDTGGRDRVLLSTSNIALIADIAVLLLAIVVVAWIIIWWTGRQSWLQFSIRGLLLFTTMAALAVGWWFNQEYRWKQEALRLAELGQIGANVSVDKSYTGPQWLRRFFDSDKWELFQRANTLNLRVGGAKSGPPTKTAPALQIAQQLELALHDAQYVRHLAVESLPIGSVEDAGFSNIESLWIAPNGYDDQMLANIWRWPNLRRISIGDLNVPCEVGDDGLRAIGRCRQLENLDLEHAHDRVTDEGMKHLGNLMVLRVLNLMDSQVGDEAISHFQALTNLRALELSASDISDRGLQTLARLPALKNLRLAACKQITDAGVASLAASSTIKWLDLAYTNVTDAGVAELAKSTSLESIDVSQCPNLTEATIQCLLNMPQLTTIHFLAAPTMSPETKTLLLTREKHGLTFINAEVAHFNFGEEEY